jgi:hypothetical protein
MPSIAAMLGRDMFLHMPSARGRLQAVQAVIFLTIGQCLMARAGADDGQREPLHGTEGMRAFPLTDNAMCPLC